MIRESLAIIAVALLLMPVLARGRSHGFWRVALMVTPVLTIPFLHILMRMGLYLSGGRFWGGIRPAVILAFADVVALGAACAAAAVFSQKIASSRVRKAYWAVMMAYNVVLGWAYIFTTIQPLFA